MKYQCNDQHLGLKTTFPIKKDMSLVVLGYFKRNQSPDIYLRSHGTDICQILSGHDIILRRILEFLFLKFAHKRNAISTRMHIFTANMHLYVFICVLCFVIQQKEEFPNNFAKYQTVIIQPQYVLVYRTK